MLQVEKSAPSADPSFGIERPQRSTPAAPEGFLFLWGRLQERGAFQAATVSIAE